MGKLLIILFVLFSSTAIAQQAIKKQNDANQKIRFYCHQGDWSSPSPGICPDHNIKMLSEKDPEFSKRAKELLNSDPQWGYNLKRIEEIRYICVKGDFASVKERSCPTHKISLINESDPNSASIIKKELDSNPEWGRTIKQDEKYYCRMNDFQSVKPGKCPEHGIELMKDNDPRNRARFISNE